MNGVEPKTDTRSMTGFRLSPKYYASEGLSVSPSQANTLPTDECKSLLREYSKLEARRMRFGAEWVTSAYASSLQ
jgi:hypothetical protein